MTTQLAMDLDAIARVSRAHGASRLSVFGSAVTKLFDPECSDVDLLVEFVPELPDPFGAYFGLKEGLERLLGRKVDLVMVKAIRNPHFAASAIAGAEELYAA